jgi:hypothetical protein
MKIHVNTVHKKLDSGLNPMDHAIPLPDQGFVCQLCGMQCKSKKGMIAHIRNLHFGLYEKIDRSLGPAISPEDQKPRAVVPMPEGLDCHLCEKTFKHPRSLQDHIIVIHEMRKDQAAAEAPTALTQQQLELQTCLISEFRGEEAVRALAFVRGRTEEELKFVINKGREEGFRKAFEDCGFECNKKAVKLETGPEAKVTSSDYYPLSSDNALLDEAEVNNDDGFESDDEVDMVVKPEMNNKEEVESGEENEVVFKRDNGSDSEIDAKNSESDKETTVAENPSKVLTPKRKRKQKIMTCTDCGDTFAGKQSLERHINTVHKGLKAFECEFCQQELTTLYGYKKHKESKHQDKDKLKGDSTTSPSDQATKTNETIWKGTRICEDCGETFAGKQSLLRHISTIHMGVKGHMCEYCRKEFTQPYGLRKHIEARHLGIKHKCPHCDIEYASSVVLNNHVKTIHTKERCNFCEVCGETFASKATLNVHKYIHYPELRPQKQEKENFTCDECGKDYASRPGLRDHIAAVHMGLKNFLCDLCDQAFGRRSCLAQHKQCHHGVGPRPKPRIKKVKCETEQILLQGQAFGMPVRSVGALHLASPQPGTSTDSTPPPGQFSNAN